MNIFKNNCILHYADINSIKEKKDRRLETNEREYKSARVGDIDAHVLS